MIVVCDNGIADCIEERLGIPTDRVIYGTLEAARNVWVRRNSGKESLPYMSFMRRISFDDDDRGVRRVFVTTPTGTLRASYVRLRLEYILDHICNKVADQTSLIRRYVFWAGQSPVIQVPDTLFDGDPWVFPVNFESPEDSSDLEAEDETGRIVRTTLNFSVRTAAVAFENYGEGAEYAVIKTALARILLYDGENPSDAIEVAQITVTE